MESDLAQAEPSLDKMPFCPRQPFGLTGLPCLGSISAKLVSGSFQGLPRVQALSYLIYPECKPLRSGGVRWCVHVVRVTYLYVPLWTLCGSRSLRWVWAWEGGSR